MQRPPTRRTGAVQSNIASASGVLTGLRAAGLQVPGDISVITIHDHPLAEAFAPALTTVSMPLFELGRRAVSLLLNNDAQTPIEQVIRDGLKLIGRDSTAPATR